MEVPLSDESLRARVSLLLRMLDDGYTRKAWHGPNLKGSLRGVTAEDAAWRPASGRHNIWEIALHAAYWKYAVRRRLVGELRGSFPVRGSNWFVRPQTLSEKAWRRDRAMLEKTHRALLAAVEDIDRKTLEARASMLFGIAFHDVYHAGQIQLLKRLRAARRRLGR